MKRLLSFFILGAAVVIAIAATVKISDLPLATNPSTNTFIEIADMNAVTKSSKFLFNGVTYKAVTNGMGWSGDTNNVIGGDGRERTVAGGSSLWTTNGLTGVTLASPYTNVFIAGNEAQFTVGTAETNMPSAPFGDNLPAIGDNHHFFSMTDMLDDASGAAISAYSAASNPFSGLEGLDAVAYATGHDSSIVGVTGGSYFDGGTNNRATLIGVQGIATILSGGTPRYVTGGDFHWLTVATNDIAWGAGIIIEGIINAQNASIGTNYGIFVNDAAQFDVVVGLKDNYGIYVENQTGGTNNWAIKTGLGKVEFGDAVSTSSAISAGSTNAWKLGAVKTCSGLTMIVTNYIEVVINGTTNAIPLGTITP